METYPCVSTRPLEIQRSTNQNEFYFYYFLAEVLMYMEQNFPS